MKPSFSFPLFSLCLLSLPSLSAGLLLLVTHAFAVNPAVAASAGNPVKGEELFKQCASCHQLGDAAQNLVGPNLNHLMGRKAGSIEGANYSDAMRAKGSDEELIWHEKTLFQFLAGPQRYVPGTIMGFEGLRTEKDINNVLAYLLQFSPAYEAESEAFVDPAVAAAAKLPEVRDADADEAVPEFGEDFMASADAIAGGGDLWAKQCRHCHGSSAYPGKAPKLKPASYNAEFVFDRITNGFRKMPAWKSVFTLEERKNLVAHILSPRFSP